MLDPTRQVNIVSDTASTPRWQPLEARERRVLGVLIEKAKTTPDTYPLSLNALKNGSNQKNNRFPQMQLEDEQIEDALDNLRKAGAVAVIQGDGRVEKYRHLAYEWMAVDKVELAIMAELLLRGAQTVGELRGRAARMEPIKGIDELMPLLDSLKNKNLIVYLSPPGRGAVVTHNLYQDRELEKVRRELGVDASVATAQSVPAPVAAPASVAERPAPVAATAVPTEHAPKPQAAPANNALAAALEREISDLRAEIKSLREEMQQEVNQLRRDLDDLNRQLGN